jgi:hypothetical protein
MRTGSIAAAPFVGDQFASLYLGETRVPTVPGRPVIISTSTGSLDVAIQSDGGSEITGWRVFIGGEEAGIDVFEEGVGQWEIELSDDASGQSVQVSAVNAVGESLRSPTAQMADE